MSVYLILSIIGTIFFSIGLGLFIYWFKIPPSLSETYYNLEKKHKGWGAFFYVFLVITVFILIAPMVEVAKVWGFLSAVSLGFVGAAAAFKSKHEGVIHVTATILSAIGALVTIIITGKWWVIFPVLAIVIALAYWTKTYKSSLVFWLEMVAFYSLFFSLIIFFI